MTRHTHLFNIESLAMKTKLILSKKLISLLVFVGLMFMLFVQNPSVVNAQTDPACQRNAECNRTPTPPSPTTTNTLSQDAQCVGGTAECVTNTADPSISCKNRDCDVIQKYLNPFIALLSIVVGIAVTIGIIVGGIQYASSSGDPQKAASGKKHIISAVVALIAFIFLNAFISFLLPGTGIIK